MTAIREFTRNQQVIEICQRLHRQGFLAAADGNVSYRADDCIYITPSGVAKTDIETNDMAQIGIDGEVIKGNPSSERLMHLKVYQHCPAARAVVHAHPPHAVAWSIAKPHLDYLPEGAFSELILSAGSIPIVPYARPSSAQLGDNLLPYLPGHRVMILSRHGVICWGESLEEAFYGVERVEHAARVLLLAQQLGGITELPGEEIEALKTLRRKIGNRTR